MKTEAVVLRSHGGPEVLVRETIDLPDPGPREVRVRVRAVALNHLDVWVRKGLPNLKLEYPHRLGSDIVGEVDALGPGARGALKVGDRVVVSPGIVVRRVRALPLGRGQPVPAVRHPAASTRAAAMRATSSSPTRTSCPTPASCRSRRPPPCRWPF